MKKILIACEESQAVCIALRNKGHESYSCDILPCSGGHPEWHIQGDVLQVIDDDWDMMIAFPPCTHLAVSGARHFEQKRKDGRQQQGIDFFLALTNTRIKQWAIENPIGIMSKIYRTPDQIIQPYYFGDKSRKATCLWLKNLTPLLHSKTDTLFEKSKYVKPDLVTYPNGKTFSRDYMVKVKNNESRGAIRSKTYPGIALAMAEQWG